MLGVRRRGFEVAKSPATAAISSQGQTAIVIGTSNAGTDLTHGSAFSITGSGFGTKSASTQFVRDTGSATVGSVDSQWSGASPPIGVATSLDQCILRADGFRSINVPHSNVSKFYAGRHNVQTYRSADVGLYKDYTRPSFPHYIYFSYYLHVDPNWAFNLDATDQNFKLYFWGTSGGGADSNTHYGEYPNTIFINTSVNISFHLNDDNGSYDTSNSTWYGSGTSPNPTSGWRHYQVEMKLSNASVGGYERIWADGALRLDTANRTDVATGGLAGTGRSIQIGAYARQYPGTEQYIYFSDIYMDIGTDACARLVLANNATLSSATIIVPQVVSSWTDTAITATCWKGALSTGTVHAHVKGTNNTWQYIGARTLA